VAQFEVPALYVGAAEPLHRNVRDWREQLGCGFVAFASTTGNSATSVPRLDALGDQRADRLLRRRDVFAAVDRAHQLAQAPLGLRLGAAADCLGADSSVDVPAQLEGLPALPNMPAGHAASSRSGGSA
jgi:hypothetical protein